MWRAVQLDSLRSPDALTAFPQHNLEGEDTSAEEKQLASLEAKIAEAKEEMEAAIYYERSLLHVATRMKRDATTFDRTIAVRCPH